MNGFGKAPMGMVRVSMDRSIARSLLYSITALALAGIVLLALVGCGQDEVETTADKVEDSLHNVVEATKEAAHDVSVTTKEAAHDAAVATEEAIHDAKNATK